jgi:hypothetical protein
MSSGPFDLLPLEKRATGESWFQRHFMTAFSLIADTMKILLNDVPKLSYCSIIVFAGVESVLICVISLPILQEPDFRFKSEQLNCIHVCLGYGMLFFSPENY